MLREKTYERFCDIFEVIATKLPRALLFVLSFRYSRVFRLKMNFCKRKMFGRKEKKRTEMNAKVNKERKDGSILSKS